MALVINDRVKETSTSTGTGTIDLDGAVTGFETFVAGIADANTTYYAIFLQGSNEWEVGLGTVTDATPDTLARTTVITSSNSDSAVDFSAGTKDVFCTLPASKAIYLDASGDPVGAIANVVEDTTPQLGGDLDVNGNAIVSASDGDIAIDANGTGMVTMTANSVTGDVIPGKLEGTDFANSLIVGHGTTGTLDAAERCCFVGIDAGDAIVSGDKNTGVGYRSLSSSLTGGSNTAIGDYSLKAVTNGTYNCAVGTSAGVSITGGDYNTLIGNASGDSVTGNYNITLGKSSGQNISSGDGNVIIGNVDAASATDDVQLKITGYDGTTTANWISGESTGNVEVAVNWNPSLSTTGKALVMGF